MPNFPMRFAFLLVALLFCGAASATDQHACMEPLSYAAGSVAPSCTEGDAAVAESSALAPLLAALADFSTRPGADDRNMRTLVRQLNRILAASQPTDVQPSEVPFSSTVRWLAQEVERAPTADDFIAGVVAWRQRYRDLFDGWILLPGQDDASQAIRQLIGRYQFAEAADALGRMLALQQRDDAALAALTAYRDAEVHDLLHETDAAGWLYEKAHQLDPDDLDFLDGYADFLRRERRFGEARRVAEATLAQSANDTTAAAEQRERRARILALIGALDDDDGRIGAADAALRDALALQQDLAATTPAVHEPGLALIQRARGDLYLAARDAGDGERDRGPAEHEAEAAYLEATQIQRELAASNPKAFEPELAQTLDRLGLFYRRTGHDVEAEKTWVEARALELRLAAADPVAFGPELAQTLRRLGAIEEGARPHARTVAGASAEAVQVAARDILRRLAAEDPDYFEPDLAAALDRLGQLYRTTQRAGDAEQAFAEAIAIDRRIAGVDPSRFEPVLARTLDNLGDLYADQHQLDKAGRCYREGIDLLKRYEGADPLLRTRRLLYLQDLDRVYAAAADTAGRAGVERELAEYLDHSDASDGVH